MEPTNRGKAFFFFFLCWWRNNSTITSTTNQWAEQQPAQLHCFRHETATSESFLSVDTADFTSVSAGICVCVCACAAECCPADAAVCAVSKYPTVTAREEQRQSNYCSGRCRCVWAATASLFSQCFLSFWRVACNQGAENVHLDLQMIKWILVVPCACLAPLLIFSACAEAFLWLLVLVCVELPCKRATDCIWLWLTTLHCDVFDY